MKLHHTTITLVLASAGLLVISSRALADNWMRSEGETYIKTSLTYDTSDQRWSQDNKLVDASCTAKNWSLSQSYEHGLSYYRTFFSSLDYRDRECGPYSSSGVGDLSLGFRSRLDIYRNGRTWEVAAIIPTGYSSHSYSSVGSGLYGLRLGAFGSFGRKRDISGEPASSLELGTNLYIWEGTASEQLSGYAKYKFASSTESHFYAALEGDYALINRSKDLTTVVNQVSDYGYDRLNARIGYTTRASLYWRVSVEATDVLWGRNVNDTNSITLSFSRNFMD